MNELYKSAKFWASLGVAVIPVFYKSKQPKVRWINYTSCLPDDIDLSRWFCRQYVNAAVITGWNNLCIIDFDDMKAFEQWKAWAGNRPVGSCVQNVLQRSRMSFSARGVHIYTFCPDAINLKLPGIDILADRKYALIPPSTHPSGARYKLVRDAMPAFVPSIKDLFPADQIEPAIEKAQAPYAPPITEQKPVIPSGPYDPWESAGVEYSPVYGGGTVEAIKAHYRIQDFFPDAMSSGGGGRWMIARCPFHNDRMPSLSIDTEQQTCKCLASHDCTPKPLDVIGVYAKLHHLSNEDAIREMAERL